MVHAGMHEDPTKSIKVWNIVSEPLSKVEDANTFHWGNYIDKADYVRDAVKMARDTANTDLQLYVSNTFDQNDDMTMKVDSLVTLVKSWETDGVTMIDGYNVLLNATCYGDDALMQNNKNAINALFQEFAKSGKMVRISNLNVKFKDGDGNLIRPSNLTVAQWKAAADYMAYIIQMYRSTIPAAKQAGISLSGITSGNNYDVFPWTSVYNRTYMYEGIVNGLSN